MFKRGVDITNWFDPEKDAVMVLGAIADEIEEHFNDGIAKILVAKFDGKPPPKLRIEKVSGGCLKK